jgi:hypothetical protein
MAHKSEKFGFMLKYGSPQWKKDTIMGTKHERDLGFAKLDQVESALQGFKDDELKHVAANHPMSVMKTLAHYVLNDRGVEGY